LITALIIANQINELAVNVNGLTLAQVMLHGHNVWAVYL